MNISNIENLKQYKHIHLIGIGGISMSGIAEVLHNWGIFVTGSDCAKTKITDRLSSHGIFVSIGHNTNLVEKADFVIYSAAMLLRPLGKFFMIHRPDRLCDIMCCMRENKIEPKVIQFVQPNINTKPTHVLIEGVYGGNRHMPVETVRLVNNKFD